MPRVGLAYRSKFEADIASLRDATDCLEITTDEFLRLTPTDCDRLRRLRSMFTLLPHGLELSIGSASPPPQTYLDRVARVLELIDPPYYSDHLALTAGGEVSLGHFAPVWCTEEGLEAVVRNVSLVQDFLGLPLLLETITRPFDLPGAAMDESEFFQRLVRATGGGVLLDVTNVYLNAHNLGGDPAAFIRALPTSEVRQVHLAGFDQEASGYLLDTHAQTIQPEIWDLYATALDVCQPEFVIIERDANFPPLADLLAEVARARSGRQG